MKSAAPPSITPRLLPFLLVFLFLASCNQADWQQFGRQVLTEIGNGQGAGRPLTTEEIGAGLKEALRVGSERVVAQLGRADGFNADAAIRIPLPEKVAAARAKLVKIGLAGVFDDLEVRLNRAAEGATPQAKAIFGQAIREMTIEDVRGIFAGPDDAATRYFRQKMTPALAAAMRPLVEQSLNEVGAVRVYNQAVSQLRAVPFAPEIKTDLAGYVLARGMDGIFHYLAQEEAAIRKDPVRRTTELLRRVFGAA